MTTKTNELTYSVMESSERYQEFKTHEGSLIYDCRTGNTLDLNQIVKRLNALEHLREEGEKEKQ